MDKDHSNLAAPSDDPQGQFASVGGFNLFYKAYGNGSESLLCLHGGPGGNHLVLTPLRKLGDNKIKVILYDQVGCLYSDKPKDNSVFTLNHAVEEVEGMRRALNLGKMNLLGVSWGGQLALQYALKYQENLRRLIISGGYASVPETVEEMKRLKSLLPREVQEVLSKYGARWAFRHPEYLKAVDVYYHNFLCRLPQWPEEVTRSGDLGSLPVYWTMWGPNEFTAMGNLKDWSIVERLAEIHVPTLITVGRFDEVTPKVAETVHRGISGSRLVVFEKSGHLCWWEEEEKYLKTVRDFILEQ